MIQFIQRHRIVLVKTVTPPVFRAFHGVFGHTGNRPPSFSCCQHPPRLGIRHAHLISTPTSPTPRAPPTPLPTAQGVLSPTVGSGLTAVLGLPHGVCQAPEGSEDKEQGALAGVRTPQQEGQDAGDVGDGTCSRGGGSWSHTGRWPCRPSATSDPTPRPGACRVPECVPTDPTESRLCVGQGCQHREEEREAEGRGERREGRQEREGRRDKRREGRKRGAGVRGPGKGPGWRAGVEAAGTAELKGLCAPAKAPPLGPGAGPAATAAYQARRWPPCR